MKWTDCKRNRLSEQNRLRANILRHTCFSATILAALRVGNSMPTCFSNGKVRWTVEKPMWLARAIQTRLMREFFCL
ncbi:hypothetical protein FAH67_00745 [Neisseria flavescens]|nr:hypothetical protein FAH67_00745 [Neisseria flavescens]